MTKNLLSLETSPYLLQHKDNPVHWYPWGDEAFAAAKTLDKPILLSIGYAACHWCHVMAHESFEDPETATLMNDSFINVKVDREEFPDVDKLYMDAVHAFGERGGWPLTMFLEPDGTPFWGGTYFPKQPQYGRPSFQQVLSALSRTWQHEHDKVSANKQAILNALQSAARQQAGPKQLTFDHLKSAADMLVKASDPVNGGLSGAPKFPQTTMYEFLWRIYLETGHNEYREIVLTTLTHLCQGGIYDHLAGGFARYSVDERWLAPHFEKMLYDNALILDLLILVNNSENNRLFRKRIEQTVEWLFSQMSTPSGAFAASYDADSEGGEGTFYIWSYREVSQVIPETNRKQFCKIYDISPQGNWEGKNIPNRLFSLELLDRDTEDILDHCKQTLLEHRNQRPFPGWDDKVLADWNGLAISMLCNASAAFKRQDWLDRAIDAYEGTTNNLWENTGLQHAYRAGKTTNIATADDYANLIKAALSLFEATNDNRYLRDAENLAKLVNRDHWREGGSGYFFASSKTKHLLVRSCHAHDDATPNANGTMLTNLAKLFHLTGNTRYDQQAQKLLAAFSSATLAAPLAHTGFLRGFLDLSSHTHAVAVIPENDAKRESLIYKLKSAPRPITVSVVESTTQLPDEHPAKNKQMIDNTATIYICKGNVCSAPITDIEKLNEVI